ncbi:MAG: PEP-CTERM sorting domain-containing protein [Betaproteobacteria bacterium]|nr:PEP-CTERM sorting domain-containing protein [Betaproteobacteria bacterium]
MYVTWSASTLYIAFATGQNPNGSNTSYAPGDIAIDIGNNGTWDYGIELQGNGGLTQGRVYASPTWTGFGLWSTNDPTSLASGTGVGSVGQVAYTTTGQTNYGQYTTDQHYFYEVAVPLSAFGSSMNVGAQFKVHWTMGCANDVMVVSTTRNVTSKVPEPGTLALLPLGLIGIAALRRRARS